MQISTSKWMVSFFSCWPSETVADNYFILMTNLWLGHDNVATKTSAKWSPMSTGKQVQPPLLSNVQLQAHAMNAAQNCSCRTRPKIWQYSRRAQIWPLFRVQLADDGSAVIAIPSSLEYDTPKMIRWTCSKFINLCAKWMSEPERHGLVK